MTRKGEAPAVARGLGLRAAGPQSAATGKKKKKTPQPPTPNSGVRGWQAHVPGKAGFRVVLSGEGVPAPKRDLNEVVPAPASATRLPASYFSTLEVHLPNVFFWEAFSSRSSPPRQLALNVILFTWKTPLVKAEARWIQIVGTHICRPGPEWLLGEAKGPPGGDPWPRGRGGCNRRGARRGPEDPGTRGS